MSVRPESLPQHGEKPVATLSNLESASSALSRQSSHIMREGATPGSFASRPEVGPCTLDFGRPGEVYLSSGDHNKAGRGHNEAGGGLTEYSADVTHVAGTAAETGSKLVGRTAGAAAMGAAAVAGHEGGLTAAEVLSEGAGRALPLAATAFELGEAVGDAANGNYGQAAKTAGTAVAGLAAAEGAAIACAPGGPLASAACAVVAYGVVKYGGEAAIDHLTGE